MKKLPIQQVWTEAWRRFRANWIPIITLLPMPNFLGGGMIVLAALGISTTVSQCRSRTASSSVQPRENIATKAAFAELKANNAISAPEFYDLGNPVYHDDYEKVLDHAEKSIERYKDSLNNLLQQVDATSSKEIEEERDAKLKEVDEWREKMMGYADRLQYTRPKLVNSDEFAEFLYSNLGYEYKEAYMQGHSIKDWAIENVKEAIQRVYESKRMAVIRDYKRNLSAIEQKKKEKKEEYEQSLRSLESAKEDIKSAREELDEAKVSNLKKFWVYLTSLILILVYSALLLVGFVWAALGTDQIALSVNKEGISSIYGDILPNKPLKVALNFIILAVINFGLFLASFILLSIFLSILSFIFEGGPSSMSELLSSPLFPLELILLVAFVILVRLFVWPSGFLILDGRSPIAAFKESVLFLKQHWQKVLLLSLTKNIAIFTIIFYLLLYLGLAVGTPLLGENIVEKLLRGISIDISPLVIVIMIAGLWVLFSYLTVMEAQLYVMIQKGKNNEESPSLHAAG